MWAKYSSSLASQLPDHSGPLRVEALFTWLRTLADKEKPRHEGGVSVVILSELLVQSRVVRDKQYLVQDHVLGHFLLLGVCRHLVRGI